MAVNILNILEHSTHLNAFDSFPGNCSLSIGTSDHPQLPRHRNVQSCRRKSNTLRMVPSWTGANAHRLPFRLLKKNKKQHNLQPQNLQNPILGWDLLLNLPQVLSNPNAELPSLQRSWVDQGSTPVAIETSEAFTWSALRFGSKDQIDNFVISASQLEAVDTLLVFTWRPAPFCLLHCGFLERCLERWPIGRTYTTSINIWKMLLRCCIFAT